MKTKEIIEVLETIKRVGSSYGMLIEPTGSEMSKTGEPVLRVTIKQLDIEVEEPLCLAIKQIEEMIEDYFKVEL